MNIIILPITGLAAFCKKNQNKKTNKHKKTINYPEQIFRKNNKVFNNVSAYQDV